MAPRALPDFIIGGPPRSGTSSLFINMSQHPQICTSSAKEPWYFTTLEDRRRYRRMPIARVPRRSWYESLFSHCPEGAITGEGSTVYFYAPGSAQLIRDAAPHAKLIFILRDPIDRIYSNYLHDLRSGRLPAFAEMVERGHPRLDFYVYVSRYSLHLERYRSTFPSEQILVLFLEDMRLRPDATIARAYSFVGADPSFVPEGMDVPRNVASRTRSRVVARLFSPRPLPFPGLHRWWSRLSAAVRRYNYVRLSSTVEPELRRKLLPLVADDVERLERMLGRSLESWRTG